MNFPGHVFRSRRLLAIRKLWVVSCPLEHFGFEVARVGAEFNVGPIRITSA